MEHWKVQDTWTFILEPEKVFVFVKSIFKNKELIVDFFREIIISLGAYGCYQPGCYDVFDIVACSHSRAHQYYMASIKVCALSKKE